MQRPTATDPDNPQWTADDFAKAKPASALPDYIQAAFPRPRGLQKMSAKVAVSIRLSPEGGRAFQGGRPRLAEPH